MLLYYDCCTIRSSKHYTHTLCVCKPRVNLATQTHNSACITTRGKKNKNSSREVGFPEFAEPTSSSSTTFPRGTLSNLHPHTHLLAAMSSWQPEEEWTTQILHVMCQDISAFSNQQHQEYYRQLTHFESNPEFNCYLAHICVNMGVRACVGICVCHLSVRFALSPVLLCVCMFV
jgi:hypothetical protein